MRRGAIVIPLVLAACSGRSDDGGAAAPAGRRLEAAAVAAGLVRDPAQRSPVGSWALDTDRACIVPAAAGMARIGLAIDYGEGQRCAAAGTARQHGEAIDLDLGACRVTARYDGDRIVLPAAVPGACDALCDGRASLAAMTVERLSGAVSEAQTFRLPDGSTPCGD